MEIDYQRLARADEKHEEQLPRVGRSWWMKAAGVGFFAYAFRLFVPKSAWASCTHNPDSWAGPCDCFWCCHCRDGHCFCSACSPAWTCGSNHCWYVKYNGGTYQCCDNWEGSRLCCCRRQVG